MEKVVAVFTLTLCVLLMTAEIIARTDKHHTETRKTGLFAVFVDNSNRLVAWHARFLVIRVF